MRLHPVGFKEGFQEARAAARMAAVQALYELDMVDGDPDPVLRTFIEKRWTRRTHPRPLSPSAWRRTGRMSFSRLP